MDAYVQCQDPANLPIVSFGGSSLREVIPPQIWPVLSVQGVPGSYHHNVRRLRWGGVGGKPYGFGHVLTKYWMRNKGLRFHRAGAAALEASNTIPVPAPGMLDEIYEEPEFPNSQRIQRTETQPLDNTPTTASRVTDPPAPVTVAPIPTRAPLRSTHRSIAIPSGDPDQLMTYESWIQTSRVLRTASNHRSRAGRPSYPSIPTAAARGSGNNPSPFFQSSHSGSGHQTSNGRSTNPRPNQYPNRANPPSFDFRINPVSMALDGAMEGAGEDTQAVVEQNLRIARQIFPDSDSDDAYSEDDESSDDDHDDSDGYSY